MEDQNTLLAILGALLLLIGIIGGGFEIWDVKVPKVGRVSRVLAFGIGLVLIVPVAWMTPIGERLDGQDQGGPIEIGSDVGDGIPAVAREVRPSPLLVPSAVGNWVPPGPDVRPYDGWHEVRDGTETETRQLCMVWVDDTPLPGKVVDEQCNVPGPEEEVVAEVYDVPIDFETPKFVSSDHLGPVSTVLITGYNTDHEPVVVCRAEHSAANAEGTHFKGLHPGFVTELTAGDGGYSLTPESRCIISFGGHIVEKVHYELLVLR